MSYLRTIPRDLFNEGNLLACYGKLWLELEKLNNPNVKLEHFDENKNFDIQQNPHDGSLYVVNVVLRVGNEWIPMFRPLNSREKWPLYISSNCYDEGEFRVLTDSGELTPEFTNFIGASNNG